MGRAAHLTCEVFLSELDLMIPEEQCYLPEG